MNPLCQKLVGQVITLALVSTIGGTAYASTPLAYYPFDTDLRDYSGNGNHGTMVDGDEGPLLTVLDNSGITTTPGEYAVGGGALNMAADKDAVSIPVGTLAADGDGWAIAFWCRNAEVANNKGGMVIGNNTNITDHIHVDSGSGFRVRMSNGSNSTFGLTTEDTLWHHYAVVVEDYDSDGSFDDVTLYKDGVYVNTVLNAAGTGFSATHIGDAYTSQFDFDFFGQIDEVYIYNAAITAAKVQELYGSAPDTTPPIVIEIVNDRADGPVEPGSLVTYTVTFSEDMDENTIDASDFGISGTAGGSIGTVTEIFPRFFEVQVTPASVGTLQLQINPNATLSDPAGNHLDTGSAIIDDTVITVEIDNTAPTLLSTDIQDDQNGGPVDQGATVIYTLTFSEDMDAATLDAADFGNEGTATYTIGSVTEISANVFEVEITPTSTGTLQLKVLDTAQPADEAGNLLDVTGGILDDTVLTVAPGPLAVQRLRIFLLGGQSNALGSNQVMASKLPTSPVNLQAPREDIPFYMGRGNPLMRLIALQPITNGRFGPEITMARGLADGLADGTTTQVAILKYAAGGTNLYNQWKGGGNATTTGDGSTYIAFQTAMTEGLAALAAEYPNATLEIEGMLWVQGEWDAQQLSNAQNYQANLTIFIADIRATYGADLPFIISRLSSGQTNPILDAASLATVQAAQDAVAAADPWANVINTDSFDLFDDDLHFSELGLQQIGNAAFAQLLDFLDVPTPPQISSLNPEHLSSGSLPAANLSITFDEAIAFGTGNVTLRQAGGALVESFDVATPAGNLSIAGATLTINPTADLNTFTSYYVEIDATAIEDLDGAAFAGITGAGTWSFTTGAPDTTPPAIQSLSPANGASDIAVGSNLSITFSEDVVFGTGNITLRQSGGALVESFDVANSPAGLSLSGATVTIDPTSDLSLGTTYYIEIAATAIEDLAGNGFAGISGDGTWAFTTVLPDTTPPAVQSLSPANGANNIAVGTNLTVTFDEAIAFGTGSITLRESGGALVESFDVSAPSPRLNLSGASLSIDPTANLSPSTTYYLEIDATAIDDLAGNSFVGISGNGIWNFTTAAPVAPGAMFLFDFQNDLTTDIAEGAVAVMDLSSPVSANGVTLTASVGNNLGSSRDRGANTGPNSDITRDFIQWSIATPITITISGLVADQEYAFRLWSGDLAANQIKTTDHTIAGASGGATIRHTSVSLADENATGGSLIEFPNVFSTSTGTLTYTIDYVGGGGTAATLNGFELTAIGSGDDTFSSWINSFSGLGGLTGLGDDPDGDGIPNGLENFFGTHPGEFSRGVIAGGVTHDGNTTFTFTHPLNPSPASDIRAAYRWSKDLTSFHGVGVAFEGTTVSFARGAAVEGIVTVTATVTGTPLDRLFIDIEVTEE